MHCQMFIYVYVHIRACLNSSCVRGLVGRHSIEHVTLNSLPVCDLCPMSRIPAAPAPQLTCGPRPAGRASYLVNEIWSYIYIHTLLEVSGAGLLLTNVCTYTYIYDMYIYIYVYHMLHMYQYVYIYAMYNTTYTHIHNIRDYAKKIWTCTYICTAIYMYINLRELV